MNMPVNIGIQALSEKERQTLRLIVRGHDAKSIARVQKLSVHTINERLRDARRKLAVSSSREAARLLFDAEGATRCCRTPIGLGTSNCGQTRSPRRSISRWYPVLQAVHFADPR